jgi:uncharacterized membrane protein YuzA (DUF378 family)
MHILHIVAWALLIIGGLNWGLVGALDFNLVDTIFGAGSVLSRLIYILVGLSAILAIVKWAGCTDKESCCK